jgi:hypothetical protein
MSYSFVVTAPTQQLVINAAADELDKICRANELHTLDRDAALSTIRALVDLLDPPGMGFEYRVLAGGTLVKSSSGGITNTGIQVSASRGAVTYAGVGR